MIFLELLIIKQQPGNSSVNYKKTCLTNIILRLTSIKYVLMLLVCLFVDYIFLSNEYIYSKRIVCVSVA